jgi:hypothetical protein
MIRCALGWHRIRVLETAPLLIRQGCDRCGKVRYITRSAYGRTVDSTRWT